MRVQILIILLLTLICSVCGSISAVAQQRIFGASGFQLDDLSGSLRFLRLDLQSPLSSSYSLHFPATPPPNGVNFLISDQNGNLSWVTNALPNLSAGAMWYGNSSNLATELPAGPNGSILSISPAGFPQWVTSIPAGTMVPANQISSGTLPAGTTITVGNGSTIQPSGTGQVLSNGLVGSGLNKFSGSVIIPLNAITLSIPYSGIISTSVVLVSIIDPTGQTDEVSVTSITPGVGFTIRFSGFYPTTTGQLNYLVIN